MDKKADDSFLNIRVGDDPRHLRNVMVVVVVFCCLVLCAFSLVQGCYYGVHTSASPEDTSAPSWYNEDANREYDALAEALLSGNVALEEQPPEWLTTMDNPYDPEARESAAASTDEDFRWDTAYYEGHYYVYFGIVPCLIFFVPFHLLTGGGLLPTGYPILIALIAFLAGLAALLCSVATRRFPRVRTVDVAVVFLGMALSSSLIPMLTYQSLYQIPTATALALAVWGLYFWWRAYGDGGAGFLLAGSVCVALMVGCRPPMAIVALFGMFPLVRVLHSREKRGRGLATLALPFVVVAMGLGAYNYARFGSVTDFGATYNLTVADLTANEFNAGLVGPGIFYYLFQPPALTSSAPFIQTTDLSLAADAGSYTERMFGGIIATLPFLWTMVLALFGQRDAKTLAVPAVLVAMGVVLVVVDAEFGGILARYQADFCYLFALAAGWGCLSFLNSGEQRWRSAIPLVLAVGSALFDLALCVAFLMI